MLVTPSQVENSAQTEKPAQAEQPAAQAAADMPRERTIHVTPKAVLKIRDAFRRENVKGGLRLGVLGGGCSGLSYQFKFDPKPRPTDKVFRFPVEGDEDVQVFVDP